MASAARGIGEKHPGPVPKRKHGMGSAPKPKSPNGSRRTEEDGNDEFHRVPVESVSDLPS